MLWVNGNDYEICGDYFYKCPNCKSVTFEHRNSGIDCGEVIQCEHCNKSSVVVDKEIKLELKLE